MSPKEQIISLLTANVSTSQIAKATGTSESYVSQIKATAQIVQTTSARDNAYDNLEDILTAKLQDTIGFINKPQEVLAMLVKVNGLKRRSLESGDNAATVNNTVIQITLPPYMANRYRTNSNNEIVEVNDRSLVTMGNKEVIANLKHYVPATTTDSSRTPSLSSVEV
jgi:hypothetical protein